MNMSEHVLSIVKQKKIQWLLLTAFAVVIFFINIGSDGIYAAQESRAAIVAQNMINSGNILHVAIKGEPESEKPILCYWFYAISGRIFGVNEFSVRLPSVIAAVASVLMACWLGIRIYGASTGFISGYILASMIGFINLGRLARIDIVLCAFFTAAMLFLYTGYFEKRKSNWHLYLFYIVLGLSVLLKGPVTVVLAAFVVLCMAFKDRNLKILWELKPVSGFIIGSIITIPWFAYETCRTHGDFALDFFINQNIRRFTGIDMSYCDGKRKTFFYYFPKFFANALPWSLLVPFCLYNFRKKLTKFKSNTWFLIFWVLVVFLFFSIAAVKRGDYLLPMYPAFAVLLGRYLVWVIETKPQLHKKWFIAWIVIGIAGIATAVVINIGLLRYVGELATKTTIPHLTQRDGMSIIQISDMMNAYFYPMLAALVVCLAYLFFIGKLLEKGRIAQAFYAFLAAFLVFICVFYLWIDPAGGDFKTSKYFCRNCQPYIPANAVICYYRDWNSEAVFFMNREFERGSKTSDIYDEATGEIKFAFVVADPREFNKEPEAIKAKFIKLKETIPGHQYPMILLKRK